MASVGGRDGPRMISTDYPDSEMVFLWRGQTLEGDITANASVNFYIMDEANHLAFTGGHPWQPLMSLLDISNESFHFVAPTSGYYRTLVTIRPPQERVELTISTRHYGIDLDHYQSGLAFMSIGVVLGVIAMVTSKNRNMRQDGTSKKIQNLLPLDKLSHYIARMV